MRPAGALPAGAGCGTIPPMSDDLRKSPEAAPEGSGNGSGSPGGPGSDEGRWITAAEAAGIVGRSERGTRDWLERHGIPARDDRPRLFSEAAIRAALPPEASAPPSGSPRNSPEAVPETPGTTSGTPRKAPEGPGSDSGSVRKPLEGLGEPIEAAYRVDGESPASLVPLPTMLRELESFAERIESLAIEVGTLRSDLTHVERERDQLRGRAEAAEAERDALREQLRAYAESAEFAAGMHPEPSTAVEGDDLAHGGTPEGAATGRPGVFRRWWTWLAGGGA